MSRLETDIAVLVPCYNEEMTIEKVVKDFSRVLPTAKIYVYDNNSSDNTIEKAEACGAICRKETLQGKGNVVRRMFSDIEADVYVLVDGDDTYDASAAPMLIDRLEENLNDMVNAARITQIKEAYRTGHRFGNWLLTTMVSLIFGKRIGDLLSGYRVFSRRFVKSFPSLSSGFEIETELTVHALELRMPVSEVETHYKERPEGSISKLNTYKDGFRILKTIAVLLKEERPFQFFFSLFVLLAITSISLSVPIILEYMDTGLVPRFPTAILSTGLMLLAFICLTSGLVLDTVTRGRREMKRIAYLSILRTRK